MESPSKKRTIDAVDAFIEDHRIYDFQLDLVEKEQQVKSLQNQLADMERELARLRAENINLELRVTLAMREKNEAATRHETAIPLPPPPRVSLPPLPLSDAGLYRGESFDRHWVNRDTIRGFIRANVSYIPHERQTEILIPKAATDHDLIILLLHTVYGEHHARHEEARINFERLSDWMYRSCQAFSMGRCTSFEGTFAGQYA
jgi:hypothetical protein